MKKYIVEKIYDGYNNFHDLKNKFYDDLTKELRNEPDKIEFLKRLIIDVESIYPEKLKRCKTPDCNCMLDLKESAIKIINSKISEITKENEDKTIMNVSVDNSTNKNVINYSSGVTITQSADINAGVEHKESWLKINIKFFYYAAGSIAFIYAFIHWVLPHIR